MEINDIFEYETPKGEKVIAVVLDVTTIDDRYYYGYRKYTCYGQNRIFTYWTELFPDSQCIELIENPVDDEENEVLVEYAVLPAHDEILSRYQQQNKENNEISD